MLCGEAVPVPGAPPPVGEIGVAPRLPVIPCRVVNSVVLTPERNREAVAAAIRHAITRKCQVVSMSLGIPFMPFFATGGMGHVVDEAYEAGMILVAPAARSSTACATRPSTTGPSASAGSRRRSGSGSNMASARR